MCGFVDWWNPLASSSSMGIYKHKRLVSCLIMNARIVWWTHESLDMNALKSDERTKKLCVHQTFSAFMSRLSCVHDQNFVRSADYSCVHDQTFVRSPDYSCVHDQTFVRSPDYSCVHDQTRAFTRLFVRSCPDFRAFFLVSRPCKFDCTTPPSCVNLGLDISTFRLGPQPGNQLKEQPLNF